MELSAYPRHRKRCLNGFRASFTLFTNNNVKTNRLVAPQLTVSRSVPPQVNLAAVPKVQRGRQESILNSLADEICQEAGGVVNTASSVAFAAEIAIALQKRVAGNVIAMGSQSAVQSKEALNNVAQLDAWSKPRQREEDAAGPYIRKNSRQQIIETCSGDGEKIGFGYSPLGDLRIFTRYSAAGEVLAIGVRESDHVIVKDALGRVMLSGQEMSVSQSGRLVINQGADQFLSIDLLRAFYTERRPVEWKSGDIYSLKAMFALDGFRMFTCFQSMSVENNGASSGREPLLMRFYGRDGSVLAFDSTDKLAAQEPSQLEPAGTRSIKSNFADIKSARQSAWDSVDVCARADWDYFVRFVTEE